MRNQLRELLRGGHAHATFEQAVSGFPVKQAGARPHGAPHSGWELLEHLRIAQNDIVCFSRSADYVSPKWPEGYWPDTPSPEREGQWKQSVEACKSDLAEFEKLLEKGDLYTPFAWADEGQTLLREALLIADHNAYHIGQLVLLRKLLGVWR